MWKISSKWNWINNMITLQTVDNEWLSGSFPVEQEPSYFDWKKAKMPYELWKQIMGFMFHTQITRKAEAQIRLYYNDTLNQWTAMPLPQYPSGMTTKEEENHPMEEEIRAE